MRGGISISHLRDKFRQILTIRESPHRIALAFSVGVFIGMSPLIGLHTVLGLLVAWAFRLNKFVSIVGIYVTNPWTIVPIYSFGIWIGAKILSLNHIIPDIDWAHLSMKELLHTLGPLLMPFLLGTTVLGSVSALLSYAVVYRTVKKSRA
ncbi:MAG: DUF2062 domain-containing protein [Nitrospirae bacterium]|nr:DUF2062 domain-containing protein [Nitrospirota bacterium]